MNHWEVLFPLLGSLCKCSAFHSGPPKAKFKSHPTYSPTHGLELSSPSQGKKLRFKTKLLTGLVALLTTTLSLWGWVGASPKWSAPVGVVTMRRVGSCSGGIPQKLAKHAKGSHFAQNSPTSFWIHMQVAAERVPSAPFPSKPFWPENRRSS